MLFGGSASNAATKAKIIKNRGGEHASAAWFAYVLSAVQRNYFKPVSSYDLVYFAAQNMLEKLDPHSAFLPPRSFQQMRDDTSGEFGGIGLVVTKAPNKPVLVEEPIDGSPAARAGIKKGDKISAVGGKSTLPMSLDDAVNKMKGRRGTPVIITVERKGWSGPRDFHLIRDYIRMKSSKYRTLEPGYGYISISMFTEHTDYYVKQGLKKLLEMNNPLKGLILDLRGNPGGLLDQSVRVAELFMEKGKVVSTIGRGGKKDELFAQGSDLVPGVPMVVLVNAGSASAAEILAGALQDHKRALIVGEPTFGKGSVQSIIELDDGSGLKLTVARYYTPNGRSIQETGIIPDVVVRRPVSWKPRGDGTSAQIENDYVEFVGLETLKAWSKFGSSIHEKKKGEKSGG